jgi:hypothetical protein
MLGHQHGFYIAAAIHRDERGPDSTQNRGKSHLLARGTDERFAARHSGYHPRYLDGISEIRGFFRTNTAPVYFFGPTAFNLLGIDRWVRNFRYVAYLDSWDGGHPRVFSPKRKPYMKFESSEEISTSVS